MFEAALEGVRFIDLTHYLAGPYCTKLLADFGADVVKVEKPAGGDGARRLGPFLDDDPHPEKSGLFAYLNSNKRGITLNLGSETGKGILLKLVKDADLLIENFSPRVMPGLGLSYTVLAAINPRLVMVSISNFGQTGPYRDFKASELVLSAMGSQMHSRGLAEREPLKMAGNAVQYQAGTVAAVATNTALWAAERKGKGDHLDVAIFDTQIGTVDMRGSCLLAYQYARKVARRAPGESFPGYPSGIYMCSDGFVCFTVANRQWDRVMKMLDYPAELGNPAMNTPAGQLDPELKGIFDAYFVPWCLEQNKQDVFRKAREARVFCGPLNTMEDVVRDPHFQARGFFAEVEHPAMGRMTLPGAPFKMSDTPWRLRRPAPLLGQHNQEVYEAIGYCQGDLVRLRESGII